MEADKGSPRHAGDGVDNDDTKNVAHQSTVLVATIQDIREKISEVEVIFCRELFPIFQSKSWNWNCLLLKVEELQIEKQKAQEQIRLLNSSLEQEKLKLTENLQLLNTYKIENELLLEMKTEVNDLQKELKLKTEELAMKENLREQLHKQVEFYEEENSKLKNEKRRLSRHYNYAISKFQVKNEADQPKLFETQENSPSQHCRSSSTENVERNINKSVKEEIQDLPIGNMSKCTEEEVVDIPVPGPMDCGNSDDETQEIKVEGGPYHDENFKPGGSASSSFLTKFTVKAKPDSLVAPKKTVLSWRSTRSRHDPGGADPHDDFLDTPLENVKRNCVKAKDNSLVVTPNEDPSCSSEDETCKRKSKHAKQEQVASILKAENRGFKFDQTVRKKAERENLIGVECKQCKKFYDAVLPDNGQRDVDKENDRYGNNSHGVRCEHHIGVSRHRYKYIPPSTPEGFWNIGFDSDM
ncbi:hypothetical protein H6P81_008428 [Aristolochia fimbriata]|uniref:DNA endonuclease activator Ctp1 C-terminal domain-containing protein n=1 Tax=Aristolochia fimbriata TaxID=158543 RepID=A0AAV7EHZ8_ARIFI|nr:hypothetical protein H6P81_008428 [Aristolochia fimbriata]